MRRAMPQSISTSHTGHSGSHGAGVLSHARPIQEEVQAKDQESESVKTVTQFMGVRGKVKKLKTAQHCPPELRGGPVRYGKRLLVRHEGNVYVDNKPICDDGWGQADADVVCRFDKLFYSKS